MPLQDKILNGLRTLLGWSGKPTSRRRPKRRLTEQYNVLLNVVHPVAEENEDVKLASGYVDTGFRLDKFKLEEVDGSEVTIHGSIRYHFVRENLPNLVGRIIPVPDNAPAVQVVSGNEVKVLGWLPIDCLAEQETKTVRLPRARWTMNCLVIEVDSNVEDVLIGTTAIKQWRLLTGSAWTLFMLGRLRPSHTPGSEAERKAAREKREAKMQRDEAERRRVQHSGGTGAHSTTNSTQNASQNSAASHGP